MVRKTPSNQSISHFEQQLILSLHIQLSERREGKRETQVMQKLVLLIKFILLLIIFQVSFSLNHSVGRQLATSARILVAKYFFHWPRRPKWSQLGALYANY